ncbi:hypothetical protein [Janthinobacterium sp. PAMC25594]|nr:hypothetical protein [Janthinobacterium sp. PAMC25594]QYG07906.1 hypothetical protein KY494_03605 [Janthinobacterium sp. PAMC25594]
MILQCSSAEEIQLLYPATPQWAVVEDGTLVELVRHDRIEPSCAGLALGEMACRKHRDSWILAAWLLDEEDADVWLRTSALGTVLSHSVLLGFDMGVRLVAHCDVYMLDSLVVAVNDACQGELLDELRHHPLIPLLKQRIASLDGLVLPHADLAIFEHYLGAIS